MTKRFGATHVATSDKSCGTWFSFVKAFTLAEVLITLGIIGVVAAMTIPTLVKNYQKTVWVNQLKKSVSTIENGFKLMLADEEVSKLSDTKFGKLVWEHEYLANHDDLKEHNAILKKYFNIVKSFDNPISETSDTFSYGANGPIYKELGNDDYYEVTDPVKVYMADGTVYGFGFGGSNRDENSKFGDLYIDVNGDEKGPNRWGRDVFLFVLKNNGILKVSSTCTLNAGEYCAARIISNGWKMDY